MRRNAVGVAQSELRGVGLSKRTIEFIGDLCRAGIGRNMVGS